MLENAAESPASSARGVGRGFAMVCVTGAGAWILFWSREL